MKRVEGSDKVVGFARILLKFSFRLKVKSIVMSKLKVSFATVLLYFGLYQLPVEAQIVPDDTLGHENSTVIVTEDIQITGGAQRQENLYHSFSNFSIPEGFTANFDSSSETQRIFTRVTGSTSSIINGLITSSSPVDLYIINPNGIDFLPNATLDIGGSFVATTANRINFLDRSTYAVQAQAQKF